MQGIVEEFGQLVSNAIYRSLELKDEYEKLKEAQEKATESSAITFNKKKTVSAEMKQFREQKEEAERFKLLITKKVSPSMNAYCCSIF